MAKFNIESIKTLQRLIKELAVGLKNLKFSENFTNFIISDTISTGSTITVPNRLKTTDIRYIITDNNGDGTINRTTPWNDNFVSFINNGSIDAKVEILVFKK